MLKAYPFGEWTPDLANNVVTQANNVRAIANGYAPLGSPSAVTAALPGTFNGGASFIDSASNATTLIATASYLYKYGGTSWTSISALTSSQVVRFAQFGDNVVLAPGGTAKAYSLTGGAVTTPTDAPALVDVAQVRDFVMGITPDNKIQWCQFNDSSTWTTGVNQADYQPVLSSHAVRIFGGEYGILLKQQGIERISYVGNDIIFQFDEISSQYGCIAPGAACQVGSTVFFLSERGFMACDGENVLPLGDEKFNRWFFSSFSRADIAGISSAVDPRNSLVLWAMPGTPGLILAYNWVLKRATTITVNVSGVFTGYGVSTSIDALDALYGNLDAIPVSLDSTLFQGGNPVLMIADGSNALSSLTGTTLEATLQLDNVEPTPGRRSRIRGLRFITDATTATATVDAKMRSGDDDSVQLAASMRLNGKLPIRANGRYNTIAVTIPAGTNWSFIQGCEVEFEAGDGR